MSKPERNVITIEDMLARNEKSNVLFFNYDNQQIMIGYYAVDGRVTQTVPYVIYL